MFLFWLQESEKLESINAELKAQIEELKSQKQQLVYMLNLHRPTCIVRAQNGQTPEDEKKLFIQQIKESTLQGLGFGLGPTHTAIPTSCGHLWITNSTGKQANGSPRNTGRFAQVKKKKGLNTGACHAANQGRSDVHWKRLKALKVLKDIQCVFT